MKKVIRVLLFLRRHFNIAIAIPSVLCMIFVIIFLSLRPVKVVEGKNAEQLTFVDEKKQVRIANDKAKERAAPEYNVPAEKNSFSYATSHKKTDQPIIISDIYAEENSIVVFKSFYPEASGYTWEIFDGSLQEWTKVSAEDIAMQRDELDRNISFYIVTASKENNNLMVRCTIDFFGKESITDMAILYILDKSITAISFDDFTTGSAQYMNAIDIPVNVKYEDGSGETITGLNGLYFLDMETSSEETTSVSGNAVETVTTVIKSYEYMWIDTGEKNVTIRYKSGNTSIDAPVNLIGEDIEEPVISRVTVDDLIIRSEDEPVPVKVMIDASDNCTQYQDLQYAFLPEGKIPEETNWENSPAFDTEITQNGKWIAYCRDQAGNIATTEKEIIAFDNKAPIVSLQLENDSWCQDNKILVNVTDDLSVEYCFICAETGEESDWITRNEYEVEKNGTWKVRVRDAAGNVTEQDIVIDNIDNQSPVIIKITEKEGEASLNEED